MADSDFRQDTPEPRPVKEQRVAFYRRLNEAERRLEALRERAGVSEAEFDAALAPNADGDPDDLYRLSRAIALIGGRLELRAVFAGETVSLMLEPPPGDDAAISR
jgi:hypothetical protein